MSEQQLIDCSWGFGNRGCKGGYPHRAMQWVIKHGGLATEESYGRYLAQVKRKKTKPNFSQTVWDRCKKICKCKYVICLPMHGARAYKNSFRNACAISSFRVHLALSLFDDFNWQHSRKFIWNTDTLGTGREGILLITSIRNQS